MRPGQPFACPGGIAIDTFYRRPVHPLPHDSSGFRRFLTGAASSVAVLCGFVVLAGVLAGKSKRLYPADATTGATLATEGVRSWMLLAFALAVAALALFVQAVRSNRRGGAHEAALAAVLAAIGFGGAALVAVQRLAALSAEAARAAYDLTPGAGLFVVAWVAPVGALAALAYALLIRLGARTA